MTAHKHKPISVFLFWTAKATAFARATIRVTGRQLPDKSDAFAHMGLGFDLANGDAEYYECLFSEGFAGPKPLQKLIQFHKDGGRLCIKPVPGISMAAAAAIKNDCHSWVGLKGYYAWQLISMWSFERIGRHIGAKVPHSPNRLVCSEAVARLLWPHLDLRDPIRDRFDAVNPNSAYRRFREIYPLPPKCPTNDDLPENWGGALITRRVGRSPVCNSVARDLAGNAPKPSPKTTTPGDIQ